MVTQTKRKLERKISEEVHGCTEGGDAEFGVTEQDARRCETDPDDSLWRPLKRPELGGAVRYNDKRDQANII